MRGLDGQVPVDDPELVAVEVELAAQRVDAAPLINRKGLLATLNRLLGDNLPAEHT